LELDEKEEDWLRDKEEWLMEFDVLL